MENLKTVAGRMACATKGLSAWNWDAFPAHKARIARTHVGKLGTVYVFDDGSIGYVAAGNAELREVTSYTQYRGYLARYGLPTLFNEEEYARMLVGIGEGNVYGVACDMNAGLNLETAMKVNDRA